MAKHHKKRNVNNSIYITEHLISFSGDEAVLAKVLAEAMFTLPNVETIVRQAWGILRDLNQPSKAE